MQGPFSCSACPPVRSFEAGFLASSASYYSRLAEAHVNDPLPEYLKLCDTMARALPPTRGANRTGSTHAALRPGTLASSHNLACLCCFHR